MIWCPFFDLPRRRSVARSLDAINTRLTEMENAMNDIVQELKALHEQITSVMKSKAADIDAAVAKAKAAWDADNQADHDAAIAELQAIQAELSNPPAFSPSGN